MNDTANIPLRLALERIEQAEDLEMTDILEAITRRYDRMFPAYEVMFASFHKEGPERRQDIQRLYEFLLRIEDRKDAKQQ